MQKGLLNVNQLYLGFFKNFLDHNLGGRPWKFVSKLNMLLLQGSKRSEYAISNFPILMVLVGSWHGPGTPVSIFRPSAPLSAQIGRYLDFGPKNTLLAILTCFKWGADLRVGSFLRLHMLSLIHISEPTRRRGISIKAETQRKWGRKHEIELSNFV